MFDSLRTDVLLATVKPEPLYEDQAGGPQIGVETGQALDKDLSAGSYLTKLHRESMDLSMEDLEIAKDLATLRRRVGPHVGISISSLRTALQGGRAEISKEAVACRRST